MIQASKFQEFLFRYGIFIAPVVLLLLHLPFLVADPDLFLSHSRDAHSDEGLNTSQIRNFVNHGIFDPNECDNLIKNPFFNLLLLAPLWLFGTKLWVARLTVLIFCLVVLIFISRERTLRWFWLLFACIALIQFHTFSYMHYSMAEMVAVFCILSAVYHCFQFIHRPEKRTKHILLAVLFSSLAWYSKIQFAYMAAFTPLVFFSWLIKRTIITRQIPKAVIRNAAICVLATAGLIGLYYLAWYLPLRGSYDYIIQNQTSNRFAHMADLRPIAVDNYWRYFRSRENSPLTFVFFLGFVSGILFYFTQPGKIFKVIFPIIICWLALESHKFAIQIAPARYLVSTFTAMSLLITSVFYEAGRRFLVVRRRGVYRYAGILGLVTMLWLLFSNLIIYREMYARRTFHIHEVNQYLSHYQLTATAVGAWSPTLTWDTRIRAVPVWSGYMNDHNIKERFNPVLIFSEPEEQDSEQAFQKDGIHLQAEADSMHSYMIGKWTVNLYWIR